MQEPVKTGAHELSAEATLEPDSLWFDGHFPGMPILPGIAQLAIVSDILKWSAKQQGSPVMIAALTRVRFRQFIRPGDTVSVIITQDAHDPSAFRFRIVSNGQAACSGTARTAPPAA